MVGQCDDAAFFQPMDIGQDYVLGVARDANGVETVVRYRLGTATQLR